MDRDKVTAKAAFDAMTFGEKVNHIWYYYKFYILGSIAAVLIVISLIYGLATRVHPDLTVIFLSRNFLAAHNEQEITESLEEWILPHIQSANNNGRTTVTVIPMFFDPEHPTEVTGALMQSLDMQLVLGDVKLFIADEALLNWINVRHDGLILRYAEMTNYPPELEAFLPLFVAERIEYERHMTGRHAERKMIEHTNAREIFDMFAE